MTDPERIVLDSAVLHFVNEFAKNYRDNIGRSGRLALIVISRRKKTRTFQSAPTCSESHYT